MYATLVWYTHDTRCPYCAMVTLNYTEASPLLCFLYGWNIRASIGEYETEMSIYFASIDIMFAQIKVWHTKSNEYRYGVCTTFRGHIWHMNERAGILRATSCNQQKYKTTFCTTPKYVCHDIPVALNLSLRTRTSLAKKFLIISGHTNFQIFPPVPQSYDVEW